MRLFCAIFLTCILSASQALACPVASPDFGRNTESTLQTYKIEELAISKTGLFKTGKMGGELCDDLPNDALVELTFIDDMLVQITVSIQHQASPLHDFAVANFGKSDDSDRKKDSNNQTTLAMWTADDAYMVIYTKNSDQAKENLSITSKNHQRLFDKISQQRGKIMDADLKARGAGKYTPSWQRTPNNGSNDSNQKDDLDALKKEYERSHEQWKKRGEE